MSGFFISPSPDNVFYAVMEGVKTTLAGGNVSHANVVSFVFPYRYTGKRGEASTPLLWKGITVLFEDTQVFPDFDKGLDAGVEFFFFVCGRELHTNAGLSLRYDGIIEAGHIDAFVEHLIRKGLR